MIVSTARADAGSRGTTGWPRSGARAALLVCALLDLPGPASAGPRADVTRFVVGIYSAYGSDGHGIDLHGRDAPSILAPSLLALVRADDKRAEGEVGTLDFDPLCACQDFALENVRTIVRAANAHRARVEVLFRNFKTRGSVVLSLVDASSGWRIGDIGTRGMPSLAARLRSASLQASPKG